MLRWSRSKPPISERLDSYFGSTGLGGLIGGGPGGVFGPTAGATTLGSIDIKYSFPSVKNTGHINKNCDIERL